MIKHFRANNFKRDACIIFLEVVILVISYIIILLTGKDNLFVAFMPVFLFIIFFTFLTILEILSKIRCTERVEATITKLNIRTAIWEFEYNNQIYNVSGLVKRGYSFRLEEGYTEEILINPKNPKEARSTSNIMLISFILIDIFIIIKSYEFFLNAFNLINGL